MRIVHAQCQVYYDGRGKTISDISDKTIIIKNDGSIGVHSEVGNKPINYMPKNNLWESSVENGLTIWTFSNKQETIRIEIHKVYKDLIIKTKNDAASLERLKTERELQDEIIANPNLLGEGYRYIGREVQTGAGPVDILMENSEGDIISVEVKRKAMLPSVDQCLRYVEALKEHPEYQNKNIRGLIAALSVKKNTRALAEKRNVEWVEIQSEQIADY